MADYDTFVLTTELITLGQLLKAVGYVGQGGDVKEALQSRGFLVNGEPDNRRGRKLYAGDVVTLPNRQTIVIQRPEGAESSPQHEEAQI